MQSSLSASYVLSAAHRQAIALANVMVERWVQEHCESMTFNDAACIECFACFESIASVRSASSSPRASLPAATSSLSLSAHWNLLPAATTSPTATSTTCTRSSLTPPSSPPSARHSAHATASPRQPRRIVAFNFPCKCRDGLLMHKECATKWWQSLMSDFISLLHPSAIQQGDAFHPKCPICCAKSPHGDVIDWKSCPVATTSTASRNSTTCASTMSTSETGTSLVMDQAHVLPPQLHQLLASMAEAPSATGPPGLLLASNEHFEQSSSRAARFTSLLPADECVAACVREARRIVECVQIIKQESTSQ